MDSVETTVRSLAQRGITLYAEGDVLKLRCFPDVMTDDVRGWIVAHKAEILAMFARPTANQLDYEAKLKERLCELHRRGFDLYLDDRGCLRYACPPMYRTGGADRGWLRSYRKPIAEALRRGRPLPPSGSIRWEDWPVSRWYDLAMKCRRVEAEVVSLLHGIPSSKGLRVADLDAWLAVDRRWWKARSLAKDAFLRGNPGFVDLDINWFTGARPGIPSPGRRPGDRRAAIEKAEWARIAKSVALVGRTMIEVRDECLAAPRMPEGIGRAIRSAYEAASRAEGRLADLADRQHPGWHRVRATLDAAFP